jgi:hypothetical protein
MSKVEAEAKRFGRKIEDDFAPDIGPDKPDGGATGGATGGAAAAELAPKDERIANRAQAFETRAQKMGSQARAAGATRTDHDADLLGFTVPKRKGAARAVLG